MLKKLCVKNMIIISFVIVVLTPFQLSYAGYDSFTVNIPNSQGSYTALDIKKSGSGYVGPKGEYYSQFPTVYQLQSVYGMPSDDVQRERMLEQQADEANKAAIQQQLIQQQGLQRQMQQSIEQETLKEQMQQKRQQQIEQESQQQKVQQPAQQNIQNQGSALLNMQIKPKQDIPIAGIVAFLCLIVAGIIFYFLPNIGSVCRQYLDFKPKILPKISSGLFGLIILLFLLPWCTVSCNNMKIVSFTGIDLSFGKEISGGMFGETQKIHDAKAAAAGVTCLVGLLISFFLKERVVNIIQAACGWAGGILLCLLKGKWDHEALVQGSGLVTVDYHFGFWIVLLLFFATGIVNILSLLDILNLNTFKTISLKDQG